MFRDIFHISINQSINRTKWHSKDVTELLNFILLWDLWRFLSAGSEFIEWFKSLATNVINFFRLDCIPHETIQTSISTFLATHIVDYDNHNCTNCGRNYSNHVTYHLINAPTFLFLGIKRIAHATPLRIKTSERTLNF